MTEEALGQQTDLICPAPPTLPTPNHAPLYRVPGVLGMSRDVLPTAAWD